MADALLSDEDMGLAPAAAHSPTAAPATPAAGVSSSDPSASSAPMSDDGGSAAPALTIRPAAPALLSDDDMGIGSSAAPSGGVLSNSAGGDGWLAGAAKGAATGAIQGVSNSIGAVGNTADMADLLMATAESKFTGKSLADTMADIQVQRAAEEATPPNDGSSFLGSIDNGLHALVGATDPRNIMPGAGWLANKAASVFGQYNPTTSLGRAAQAGVSAVTGSVGPGVGGAAAGATPAAILQGALDYAIPNAASGAAAQYVGEKTGNPLWGMAAGLAAPAAVDSVARLGQKLPGPVGNYFQGVNQDRIGKQLYGLASDPGAVQATVNPTDLSSNPSSIAVSNFKPTTGQLTGDLGLLQAENTMKVPDNTAFNARAGQQNSAAQSAIASIAAGGDEMRPSTVLQNQLDTIDQKTQEAQQRLTAGAQALADPLGTGQPAEQAGATLRAKIEATAQQAQDLKDSLYAAVDPDGTLATTSAPITAAVGAIRKGLNPYGTELSSDEKRIYALASQMPAVMPYSHIVAFDKNINSALPDAVKESRRRLGQLKTAVMATLDGTADGVAQREAQEVAAGARDPADTVSTRLQHAMPVGAASPAAGSSVFTPSGRKIGVRYGVVDAGDLVASHRPDMTPNPDYPANLQPRDRTRAASEAQVADIAANLQPERLGASASAAEGAPIVGPDGLVESGNGRVLAIARAHQQNGPQAQAYREFLASQGFDASGMKAPVLVRQRTTDLSPEDRVRFAQEANASPVLAQSATERAATDAGRLSDTALAHYVGGDVTSAANRPFVRSFLGDVADKGEAGSFAAPDGSLSLDGARRVRNALLHAGYGDSRLVSSLAETGDPDIAAFGGVMGDNAGRMAQLRRSIAAGDVHPGADLSSPVLEAGRVVQRARANGQRLSDAVAQADAFNPISDAAHTVLKAAYGPNLTARLSRNRMSGYLDDALGEAAQQSAERRLFGEPLSATQILEGAQGRHAQRQAGTADSLPDGIGASGPGAGAAGQEGRGLGAGPRGSQGSGPGADRSVVEGPALAAGTDPAAGARVRAAKDAHIDYVRRFENGPVASAIATNDFRGDYTALPSAVPGMAIRKGDQGYEVAKAFLRDSGNHPAALEAMTDYALNPLRSSLTPEGTVSPTAYARWKRDYGPALRALNEADPGFASRYDNAAAATDLMTRAGALRERQLKAYQDKTTTKFLGATDPSEVQELVGRILEDKGAGVTRMRALVDKLGDDPDAMAGLRRAGAAYLSQRFSNAAKEAATDDYTVSTKLPKFVADRRAALQELYPEQDLNRIGAVAHVLDQKQRSVDSLKNKGTSQTSRDLAGLIKKAGGSGHGHGTTTVLALAGDRALEGLTENGLDELPKIALGTLGIGGLWALNRLRSGMAHADQAAIQDALMNPERFAHYTSRVSPDQAVRKGAALSSMIRRQLINQPIVQRATQRGGVPGYKRGGSIGGGMARGVDRGAADRAADALMRMAVQVKAQMGRGSAMAVMG